MEKSTVIFLLFLFVIGFAAISCGGEKPSPPPSKAKTQEELDLEKSKMMLVNDNAISKYSQSDYDIEQVYVHSDEAFTSPLFQDTTWHWRYRDAYDEGAYATVEFSADTLIRVLYHFSELQTFCLIRMEPFGIEPRIYAWTYTVLDKEENDPTRVMVNSSNSHNWQENVINNQRFYKERIEYLYKYSQYDDSGAIFFGTTEKKTYGKDQIGRILDLLYYRGYFTDPENEEE